MKSISCQEGGGKNFDNRNVIFAFESWKALVAKRGGENWQKECNICMWVMKSISGQEGKGGGNFDKRNVIFAFESWKALVAKGGGEKNLIKGL